MLLMKWLVAPSSLAGPLCSLFTICLMTERGPPSAPVLPNEPQREITGSIVARHRSLALIRPNKPVSSQGETHPFPPPGQDPARSSTLRQFGAGPPSPLPTHPLPYRDHQGVAAASRSQPLGAPVYLHWKMETFFIPSVIMFVGWGGFRGATLEQPWTQCMGMRLHGRLPYLPALLPPF